jgi:hypothetical protein
VSVTSGGAVYAWYTVTFSSPISLLPNSTYWVTWDSAAGSTVAIAQTAAAYPGKVRETAVNSTGLMDRFKLFGYAAPTADSLVRFDDYAFADDGDAITISAVTIPLLAAGVPYVSLKASQNACWLNGVLSNDTTGQTATLAILCTLADVITIDVGNRTAVNTTTGENVLWGVKFSDPDGWLSLLPGTNVFAYAETGLVRTDIGVSYRDRWP